MKKIKPVFKTRAVSKKIIYIDLVGADRLRNLSRRLSNLSRKLDLTERLKYRKVIDSLNRNAERLAGKA